ncbi:hypothetical protein LTR95_000956 [Oleoguttula sp. CCFEE 5521]
MTPTHAFDIDEAISKLQQELGPAPDDALCEAIRCADEDAVRRSKSHSLGLSSLRAKKSAIEARRPDFLRLLLEADSSVEEDLVFTACNRKDRQSTRMLIDFGWPANQPVYFAASLLCIRVDDADFTEWLVKLGAEVGAQSKTGETALSFAIVRGSREVVRYLIAQGAETTHGDLLHCAALRQNAMEGAELVEDLVRKGANVNAFRFDNPVAMQRRAMFKQPTPLHVACENGNALVAEVLIRHGANPRLKMLEAHEFTGPTPLDIARENGDRGLIALLSSESMPEIPMDKL